jgi:hypothetical protein
MSRPEAKNCPRCTKPFHCKAGAVKECQCFGITVYPELRIFLEQHYKNCLCADCLQFLSQFPERLAEKYNEV